MTMMKIGIYRKTIGDTTFEVSRTAGGVRFEFNDGDTLSTAMLLCYDVWDELVQAAVVERDNLRAVVREADAVLEQADAA